jgi:hypothetical protein
MLVIPFLINSAVNKRGLFSKRLGDRFYLVTYGHFLVIS